MKSKADFVWTETRAEWEDTTPSGQDSTVARVQDMPGLDTLPPDSLASALVAAINDPGVHASIARLKFLALSAADRMAVLKFLRSL